MTDEFTSNKKPSIFESKLFLPFLATTAAFAWGWAYPLIKIGMDEFNVASDDTWGKTLFAGIRFSIAGLIVLIIAKLMNRDFTIGKGNGKIVFALALSNTALHYFCFYLGLSYSYGSRASILNSLATFLLVVIACVVFPEEKMTIAKVSGCLLGFAGLLILNIGSGSSGDFTFLGDGMIILNALCSVCGGLLTRVITKRMDAIVATGMSLFYGGVMLCMAGLVMGGRITTINIKGAIILASLVLISSLAFSLYNQLLANHPVGKVAIYNALIPVFGVMLSCIFLGEAFLAKYIISVIFVASGIYVINKK